MRRESYYESDFFRLLVVRFAAPSVLAVLPAVVRVLFSLTAAETT